MLLVVIGEHNLVLHGVTGNTYKQSQTKLTSGEFGLNLAYVLGNREVRVDTKKSLVLGKVAFGRVIPERESIAPPHRWFEEKRRRRHGSGKSLRRKVQSCVKQSSNTSEHVTKIRKRYYEFDSNHHILILVDSVVTRH